MQINTLTYEPSYWMLHATCYILHATCSMQHAACCMMHATCIAHYIHFISYCFLLVLNSKNAHYYWNLSTIIASTFWKVTRTFIALTRAHVHGFFLVIQLWWINLSLKFEKDPISGCGEIDSQSWSISIKITENTLILKDQDQLKEFWNWGEAPLRFQ